MEKKKGTLEKPVSAVNVVILFSDSSPNHSYLKIYICKLYFSKKLRVLLSLNLIPAVNP